MSDVTDLLDRLTAGTTTLDDVARAFETHTWPTPPSDEERNAAALRNDDPEPSPEGSFDEVAAAYINGEIDDAQYAALAEAAAKGMGADGADVSGADAPPSDDAARAGDAVTPASAAPTDGSGSGAPSGSAASAPKN